MLKTRMQLVLIVCLLFALPAFGDILPATIDFGTGDAGTGGVFTFASNVATGSGIPIATMTVVGSAQPGTYAVTGDCDGSARADVGCLSFNTSTNTISITGAVPALGVGPTTLLNGIISYWDAMIMPNGSANFNAGGSDTKDRSLLLALGLPGDQKFAYFGFVLSANYSGTTKQGLPTSTDILNASVPDGGATLMLLGSVLVGLESLRRKFRA